MSIQTLKKKGVITCHGTKISGKNPGGIWLSQGPFGHSSNFNLFGASVSTDSTPIGPEGFSINGGRRSTSYIGKSSAYSKLGTRYRGINAIGYGGTHGKYPVFKPLLNFSPVRATVEGAQFLYIKPSVLSTKGMLEKKYRWINNGQYPNHWVQPIYPSGSLSDNASQWLYIQNKAAQNTIVNDTNKPEVYVDYIRNCGSSNGRCNTATNIVNYPYNIIANAGKYTKTLGIPQEASQYTTQIQQKCSNPTCRQKPFPFAVRTGKVGSSQTPGFPIPIETEYYISAPSWYNKNCDSNQVSKINKNVNC